MNASAGCCALAETGIWNVAFTLIALLVHNPDQEIDFRRRFDSFFQDSKVEAGLENIDLNRALKELRQLSERKIKQKRLLPKQAPTQRNPVSFSPTEDDYEFPQLFPEMEETDEVDEEPPAPVQTPETTPQPSSPPAEDYSRFPFGFAVCNGEVVGKRLNYPTPKKRLFGMRSYHAYSGPA